MFWGLGKVGVVEEEEEGEQREICFLQERGFGVKEWRKG